MVINNNAPITENNKMVCNSFGIEKIRIENENENGKNN